jgi:hypothetical protein
MIQEFRFNQYCERLQKYISQKLNDEFKLFMRWRGLNIDSSLFDIKFNAPQNFAAYRQSELDSARVTVFQAMEAFPYISKRFAMTRFLGLTEEDIEENQRLWLEEREEPEDSEASSSDLRSIGISSGDIESDTETIESTPEEGAEQMSGEMAPAVGAPASLGGATAPAA